MLSNLPETKREALKVMSLKGIFIFVLEATKLQRPLGTCGPTRWIALPRSAALEFRKIVVLVVSEVLVVCHRGLPASRTASSIATCSASRRL